MYRRIQLEIAVPEQLSHRQLVQKLQEYQGSLLMVGAYPIGFLEAANLPDDETSCREPQCLLDADFQVEWSDRHWSCCREHLVQALARVGLDNSADRTLNPIVNGKLWSEHPLYRKLLTEVMDLITNQKSS